MDRVIYMVCVCVLCVYMYVCICVCMRLCVHGMCMYVHVYACACVKNTWRFCTECLKNLLPCQQIAAKLIFDLYYEVSIKRHERKRRCKLILQTYKSVVKINLYQ